MALESREGPVPVSQHRSALPRGLTIGLALLAIHTGGGLWLTGFAWR